MATVGTRPPNEDLGTELGTLAGHFNLVVTSLRSKRKLLEQRNAEFQHSLGRQQQLTYDLRKGLPRQGGGGEQGEEPVPGHHEP